MDVCMLKRGVVSVYIVLALSTIGFVGLLVVEDDNLKVSVEAAVIYVDDGGKANYTSIQAAIDNASAGDTIYVWDGIYNESIIVNKTISLIGNGSSNTTIRAKGSTAIYIQNNFVNVSGLKIKNSSAYVITLQAVNNCKISNNNLTQNANGIALLNSNYNTIKNNICLSNSGYAIFISTSNHNLIENNILVNNSGGIDFQFSHFNKIINCSYSLNFFTENNLRYSNHNKFIDNSIIGPSTSGFYLTDSNHLTLINNSMVNCGIEIIGLDLESWNTHSIDNTNFVNWKPVYYYKNQTSGVVPSGAGQVILTNCTKIKIEKQILTNTSIGILIGFSSNITIANNICNFNYAGISLSYSNFIVINNNTCIFNVMGIQITRSNNIHFFKNTCSNNGYGIYLHLIQGCEILNNNICNNTQCGIYISYSNLVLITNNSCAFNSIFGIVIRSSINLKIDNNTLNSNNWTGINSDSNTNILIKNNICYSNVKYGVFGYSSSISIENNSIQNNENGINIQSLSPINYTRIENNSIIFNDIGINISYTHKDLIKNNNCSDNKIGLYLTNSDNNLIFENNILKNSQLGMYVDRSCHNNKIYYNNFMDNVNQEDHDQYNFNYWNNSEQEGNYWSDYNGADLPKGWNAPDGIGDTEVPHRNLDYSPFMIPYGWRYPVTPGVAPESYVVNKGNYTVEWYKSPRSIGYILEEDDNSSFSSPSMIYKGINTTMEIKNKKEGLYYYRVRSYSAFFESDWSNTWTIIVDFTPPVPKNLDVKVYPDGEVLDLSWDMNEKDTVEYEIWYNSIFEDDWTFLFKVKHPNNTYRHTGLQNSIEYVYKLRAIDSRKQFSGYSMIVSAIPRDTQAPNPPNDLNVKLKTVSSVTLIWSKSTESDVVGYNIYRSTIPDPMKWGRQVGNTTIGNEQFTNFELDEYTTYYYAITAFDEVPNESNSSIIIDVTTLPKQRPPEINHSIPDFEIPEDSYDNSTIDLFQWFSDVNNDTLNFSCLGQYHINVTIFPENGSVLLVPEHNWNGNEFLVFTASDGFATVSDEVMITVTPVNDPPENLMIVAPRENDKFEFNRSIILQADCSDVDLVYGDNLTFIWSSNISGELGMGIKLEDVVLPLGNHTITVEVWDSGDEYLVATVNISIFELEKPPTNDTNLPLDNNTKDDDDLVTQIIIASGVIVIIVVIIIISFLLLQRKKKKKLQEELISKLKVTMVTTEDPEEPQEPEKSEPAKGPNVKAALPQEELDTPTTTPSIEPKLQEIGSKTDEVQLPSSMEIPLLPPKEGDEKVKENIDVDPEVGA